MNNQAMMEFQKTHQRLQQITVQKQSTKTEQKEVGNALKELEGSKDEDVYKSVGSILISKDFEEMKKELEEKKESLEVRMKSLEKREKKLRKKVEESQKKLRSQMQNQNMAQ